jgi:nitrate reductase NapAB chaperone NapD
MSGVREYWEKYRERKKSPGGREVIEGLISNCSNNRISDLQGQINILEDRIVNLSRQVKMQTKNESFELIETIEKIDKIDKILEIKEMFDEKTSNIEKIVQKFTKKNWEEVLEDMIEKSEKKILNIIDKKFKDIDEKIAKIEQKVSKNVKTSDLELKIQEIVNKRLEGFTQTIKKTSRSRSPGDIKKKLEEFSIVQEKLQKIVIDTAEKVKKSSQPDLKKDPKNSSRFNKAIDKISDLLKNYSKAQEVLFTNFKTLEEKTRQIEEKLDNSKSYAASEPVEIPLHPSSLSFDENFIISFGSEEGQISIERSKEKKPKKSGNL